MDKEYFGVATNLAISFLVTLYGAFAWLFSRQPVPGIEWAAFRRRGYFCWWVSWLWWTLLWTWTGIRQHIVAGSAYLKLNPDSDQAIHLKIPDLVLDNLNSIFLILVFMILTRGDGFGKRKIYLAFLQIGASLTVGYTIVYCLAYWLNLSFSYGIHNAWSLCMSVAGPLMVGWAVYLRFNSIWVLVIGFVYAFMQPVAYAFDLPGSSAVTKDQITQYQHVVDIMLGGLKILWAVVFTQILAHGVAKGNNLVADTKSPSPGVKWDHRTLGHAILLGIVYTLLVVWMLLTFKEQEPIAQFAAAFGIVGGFIALVDVLWRVWREALKAEPERPEPPKPPNPVELLQEPEPVPQAAVHTNRRDRRIHHRGGRPRTNGRR